MDTKEVLLKLRTKKGLSQDELAEKIYVTSRQYPVGKMDKPFPIRKL